MANIDVKWHGSHKRELLRAWLLSHAGINGGRVDELLDQLDEEEVDCVDDLELLDLECCLKQVTARKIRRALAKRESGCCAAESVVSPVRGPAGDKQHELVAEGLRYKAVEAAEKEEAT